jgi:transposase
MWMGVFMLVGKMALEIRLLAKRGKDLRAIAREVGVSGNTVRRYLRDGDAERYRPRPQRSGKLAAFDDYIAKRLAEAAPDRLAGTVVLRERQERGKRGAVSIRRASMAARKSRVVTCPPECIHSNGESSALMADG